LSSRLKRHAPELLLALLFVALVAPVIAAQGYGPAASEDEALYHAPTLLVLADQLPHPDLVHIHTATSPGLHLVLAVVARLVSDDRGLLESVAALFSLAMVLVAYRLLRRYLDPWLALVATLPLLLSHYVLQSAAWINTDNTAVLFVLLALGAALTVGEQGRGYLRGGVAVFLAAWVRQPAVWAAGPLAAAAAIAGRVVPRLSPPEPRSLKPLARTAVALVPAVASLAALAAAWGHLTPPAAARQSGTSAAAIPFTLAIAGVFGAFFATWSVRREDLVTGRAPLLAAAGGAALALAVPTSATTEAQARTGGGLWRVVEETPVLGDRSLAITVLAALGAVLLVALWRAAEREGRRGRAAVLLVAVASLAVAQAGTVRTYQRYFEPTLLVLLALLAACGPLGGRDGDPAVRRRAFVSLGLLCGLQLAGCVAVVYSAVL
jgi:hypothetical protein